MQAAMEALILVATFGGPTTFARIGVQTDALLECREKDFPLGPPQIGPRQVTAGTILEGRNFKSVM